MIVCGMEETVANKRGYEHGWGRTRFKKGDRPDVGRMSLLKTSSSSDLTRLTTRLSETLLIR